MTDLRSPPFLGNYQIMDSHLPSSGRKRSVNDYEQVEDVQALEQTARNRCFGSIKRQKLQSYVPEQAMDSAFLNLLTLQQPNASPAPAPIPLHRRESSAMSIDNILVDNDNTVDYEAMITDSAPASQSCMQIPPVPPAPLFYTQNDGDDDGDEEEESFTPIRAITPGCIMNEMVKLEVSPSHEKVAVWRGEEKSIAVGGGPGGGGGGGGAGKKFTMGYRSDCEKCRMRVPGHWAHRST